MKLVCSPKLACRGESMPVCIVVVIPSSLVVCFLLAPPEDLMDIGSLSDPRLTLASVQHPKKHRILVNWVESSVKILLLYSCRYGLIWPLSVVRR